MNQDSRSLLAVGLSVLVFILWYSFLSPKPQKQNAAAPTATTETVNGVAAGATTAGATASQTAAPGVQVAAATTQQSNVPAKTTTIETDLYKVELTNDGGVPTSWEIKKYKKAGAGDQLMNLIEGAEAPLQETLSFVNLPQKPRYDLVEATTDNRVVYRWRSKDVDIIKEYKFDPKSYLMNVDIKIRNNGKNAITGSPAIAWVATVKKEEKRGFLGFLKGPQNEYKPIYLMGGSVNNDITPEKEGQLLWGGIEDRYFMSAIIPREHGDTARITTSREAIPTGEFLLKTKVTVPAITILPGAETKSSFSVYVGPKDRESLKAAGFSLEKAINYGWFSFVAVPILYLLKFFHGLIHNWGVAIVILTIFVKLLLNPLSRHSMKSMKSMQTLQPKLKELREKYKGDKERLNVETMQLFKTNKVNPMGGCLPMLLQLPIYIALYKVLWNSIELYRQPFFWFYRDLSAPDPFFVMPIILGVAMFFQQKLTPSASADPAQAKMMQIMPLMFTAFMLFLPSGLVLYILINTGMGVMQQYMMNKDIRFRDLLRGKLHA